MQQYKRFAGQGYVGFNNAVFVFLSFVGADV